MFNSRGQHQQLARVKIMDIPFGRNLDATIKNLNDHDTLGSVRRQTCKVGKEIQRNRCRAVLKQRLLAVPGAAGT
ncbi:MAG: hypothetical protein AMXMBFR20_29650 [Planctomycetia bacterium]